MRANINPDPHAEGFQWQPTNHVTAIIDDQDEVFSVIRRLKESGFSDEDISVFIGSEGLAKLDVHGEHHGMLGRVIRAVESVTADQHPDQEAEGALKAGLVYVTVLTDGSVEQKTMAVRSLKAHNAHNLRYFGRLTVERL